MWHRVLVIFALVYAGELIFSLPFHVARFFRPTFLEVFQFTNANLGDVFAVFGVTATLVYFPGGLLADIFSARRLMAFSLFATALGGLYMAQFPSQFGMGILFGYWGVTSIFLFWAAMIKATKEWGGDQSQGIAFGLLDGGRGLVAALAASVAVFFLSRLLPETEQVISIETRRSAMQNIIYFYSLLTASAGLLVWFVLPDSKSKSAQHPREILNQLKHLPNVWSQAFIVVCAYCAYKGLDNYGLYAVQVLGMNEVEAAKFTSIAAYVRPVAAICAGILADRILASKVVLLLFGVLCSAYIVLALVHPSTVGMQVIVGSILVSFAAVFALRGVYFALLEEQNIRNSQAGAAVGIVSLVGFTPDIFFTPIAGRILDASPGFVGFQHFFILMICISLFGLLVALYMRLKLKTASASVASVQGEV